MRGGVIRYAAKKNGPIRRNAAESGAREEKRLIGPGPTFFFRRGGKLSRETRVSASVKAD